LNRTPQTRVRSRGLILASASPRRARILDSLGLAFDVVVADVDESIDPEEDGAEAAVRLARAKALSVAASTRRPVLAADTLVLVDEHALGKPRSRRHAGQMLALLSGRAHDVVTGVCLVVGGATFSGYERTEVDFVRLSASDRRWYVATGEPLDKAGAYHIDGLGAFFVAAIKGSPSNVEGLPVGLVRALAARAGLALGPPAPRGSRSPRPRRG
jgi:septum formation protein